MPDFIVYQNFFSQEEAQPTLDILKENQVPFEFKFNKSQFDTILIGENSDNQYQLKIAPQQFEEVNKLLREKVQVDITSFPQDYYLFSFSDDELKDILQKPDEWSPQDFNIAKSLLSQKGIKYTEQELTSLTKERREKLAKPETLSFNWILWAYVFMYLGGFVGIFMGLAAWQLKKTLPDGTRVFTYSESSRRKARNIMIASFVVFVIIMSIFTFRVYEFWT